MSGIIIQVILTNYQLTSIRSTSSTRTAQLIALERNLASLVVKGKASEAEFERRMRGMRCLLEKRTSRISSIR